MGREARTVASFDGWTGEGKALLETDEVLFRGERRLLPRLPAAGALGGGGGRGGRARAARGATRILHPPTLADRLGVKPGARAALEGHFEAAVEETLRGLG